MKVTGEKPSRQLLIERKWVKYLFLTINQTDLLRIKILPRYFTNYEKYF